MRVDGSESPCQEKEEMIARVLDLCRLPFCSEIDLPKTQNHCRPTMPKTGSADFAITKAHNSV